MTSMLSQVGPASTEGNFSPPCLQRLDRVLRVVEQLAAVGAVQAVVEVVPPMAFALRAAHDRGDADRGRPDDVAAGLGDDAHALRQLGQRRADRRAEAADVRAPFCA